MKNIIFIAPPAAGKGTQAQLLKDKYGFEHISTGELLREVAASGTEFGNKIAELINNGIFVDDEIMAEMMKTKIGTLLESEGIIFDGYPRNISQADKLEEILNSFNQKIDYVISLDIDKEKAMRRALGRITCGSCGAIFNRYTDTLEKEGYCNNCSAELEKRDDDSEETFIKRFDTYMEKTQPLIDYYKEKGLLYVVKCAEEREDTFKLIEDIINKGN